MSEVIASGVPGNVVGRGISAVVEAAARADLVRPMTNGLRRFVRRGRTCAAGRTAIEEN